METRYYAAVPGLRFGEEELAVGDPVPVEDGRDYTALIRRGDIVEAVPAAPSPVAPSPGWVDLAAVDWYELVAAAAEMGLGPPEPPRTPSSWEELVAAGASLGIQPPASLVDLNAVTTEDLVALAVVHGHEALANATAEFAGAVATDPLADLVAIPDPLPTTRAGLAEVCAEIGVTPIGTGSNNYVKESDYIAAIEAERARRAQLVADAAAAQQ